RAGLEIIQRVSGKKPRGWRAPLYNFSDNSLDLLLEQGFTYDASLMADDMPYLIESRATGGRLVELPSHWGLDDWPQWVQSFDLDYMMPVRSPSHGLEIYVEEFNAAYRYGALWVPVIHPFATGRLARWSAFTDFLEQVLARGDVWFAPMEEIAAYAAAQIEQEAFVPQITKLPQYAKPVGRVLPQRLVQTR